MLLSSSFDNLVVDVGNVDLVEHVVAEVISENSANDIEGDVRSWLKMNILFAICENVT